MLYTTTYIILCINYTLIKNKNNKMKYHVKKNNGFGGFYLPFLIVIFLFLNSFYILFFGLYYVGY